MTSAFIERQARAWPVRPMGRVLEVSPSGYHGWRSRPARARSASNRQRLHDVRRIHADHMRTELTSAALMMATQRPRPAAGLIRHSDRGSQSAAEAYRKQLAGMRATPAMSRTGCCYDNAPMERFFHTLEMERAHQRR